MEFHLASRKPVEEFLEAKARAHNPSSAARPLLGPVARAVGKSSRRAMDRAVIAEALVGVYRQLLIELAAAGADWVQMDEPCLGLDLPEEHRNLFGYTRCSSYRPAVPRFSWRRTSRTWVRTWNSLCAYRSRACIWTWSAVLASSRKLWRWRPTTCCCRSARWMAEISGGRIWIGSWRRSAGPLRASAPSASRLRHPARCSTFSGRSGSRASARSGD